MANESRLATPNQQDDEDTVDSAYTIDDGTLVELVRSHLPLWLLSHSSYKDAKLKETIWLKFEGQTGVPAAVLQKRWGNLKKSYSTEKSKRRSEINKSGAAGPAKKRKRPGFAMYEAMQFLKANDKNKRYMLFCEGGYNKSIRKLELYARRIYNNTQIPKQPSNVNTGSYKNIEVIHSRDGSDLNDSELNNNEKRIESTTVGESVSDIQMFILNEDGNESVFPDFNDTEVDVPRPRDTDLQSTRVVLNDKSNNVSTVSASDNSKKLNSGPDAGLNFLVDKENQPQTITSANVLASPWNLPKSKAATAVYPTSCNVKQSKGKKDPLFDTVVTLGNMFAESLKNDVAKKEREITERDTLAEIPIEDDLFGKTVAVELAKEKDANVKQQKKAMIMGVIYGTVTLTSQAPSQTAAQNLSQALAQVSSQASDQGPLQPSAQGSLQALTQIPLQPQD